MSYLTKVVKIGDSLGIIFPDEMIKECDIKEGDEVEIISVRKGELLIKFLKNK